jgi:hypothetical protein
MTMKCLETKECWCAACTDREIADDQPLREPSAAKPTHGPIEIAWIFENGLAQKLSASVRCF